MLAVGDHSPRTPDVSVIVPTHNRRALLAVTLRSILDQRGVSFEVIVVDDGSSDGTSDHLAGLGDDRVRVIRQQTPLGVAAARNRGVAEAVGDWVAFCDDDDLWAPDKLAMQLAAGQETNRGWVYTGAVRFTTTEGVTGGAPRRSPEQVSAALPTYNAVPGGGSGVVVRRATLAAAGPFDTGLVNTEDWDLYIRLARLGPPAWVDRPLLAYRVHPGSSSARVHEILAGARIIEQRYGGPVDWVMVHRYAAQLSLRAGRRARALGHYLRAAAIRDAPYLRGDFAGDVRAVLSGAVRGMRGRIGPATPSWRPWVPGRLREATSDPWLDEARAWLRRFDEPTRGRPSAQRGGPPHADGDARDR